MKQSFFLPVTGSLALLLASLAASAATADQNWPQWRGPLNTGVGPDAHPPTTWSETSNIKWKVKVPGEGSATPIVWDNLAFVQTPIPMATKAGAETPKAEVP